MGNKIILTEDQKKQIIEMYISGMSCNKIFATIGFGRESIKKCLIDAGIYNSNRRYKKYSDDDIEYINIIIRLATGILFSKNTHS